MPVFHTKTIESILDPVAQQVNKYTIHIFPFMGRVHTVCISHTHHSKVQHNCYRCHPSIHRNGGLIPKNSGQKLGKLPDVIDKKIKQSMNKCVQKWYFWMNQSRRKVSDDDGRYWLVPHLMLDVVSPTSTCLAVTPEITIRCYFGFRHTTPRSRMCLASCGGLPKISNLD